MIVRRRALVPTLLFPLLSACAEAPEEHRYDTYHGQADPDHREPIAIPPGGLGVVTDSLSDTLALLESWTAARPAPLKEEASCATGSSD